MHAFQKINASYFCVDGRYVDRWHGDLRYRRTYTERNYMLFAALANVRNNGDVNPMCEPRGIPGWAKIFEKDEMYDFGDHSQSWLRLDEITLWEGWKQEVPDQKLVDLAGYNEWLRSGPKGVTVSATGASGPVFEIGQEKEFLACREKWKHIWIEAPVELQEHCSEFFRLCRYDLAFLSRDFGKPDDIILVFGFDS
jgi:hypothetical protein